MSDDWEHLESEEAFAEAIERHAEEYQKLPEWIRYDPKIGDEQYE